MAVRGWVQGCAWQPRGSELVSDAADDATTITIEDTTDFDDAGGIISINDQTISYDKDAVDDDAGTIFLNTGLADAATIGDPVYTVSGGQIMRDVVLFVSCGDGDDVEVRVAWEQRDYWPEGEYEDPVQVILSDDLETILDAPGRTPTSTELADARGGYEGTLQDIYDAADAAAEAAADAAANATTAMTAANGKNKVTYSLSSPGSTANAAGDIWFRKESATQTIIEQWEGLGGTSWSQKTLNDQVIANLDAGKLVAGSAFINGLSVKTNFTLGDASTNGVIQSYNFAGSSVGIYIDKFGIVAKGGSLAGASVIGGTVATAGSGVTRVELSSAFAHGISFYDGSSLAGNLYYNVSSDTMNWTNATAGMSITMGSSGISLNGPVSILDDVDMNGADIVSAGDIHGDDVYVDSLRTLTGGEAVFMGSGGRLYCHTSPSRAAWKRDIAAIEVDPDALAELDFITWRYREDVPFEVDDLEQVFHGYTYDQAEALGLTDLLGTSRSGLDVARPENLPYMVAAAWQQDHAALRAAESRITDLEGALGAMTARIEALEGP